MFRYILRYFWSNHRTEKGLFKVLPTKLKKKKTKGVPKSELRPYGGIIIITTLSKCIIMLNIVVKILYLNKKTSYTYINFQILIFYEQKKLTEYFVNYLFQYIFLIQRYIFKICHP